MSIVCCESPSRQRAFGMNEGRKQNTVTIQVGGIIKIHQMKERYIQYPAE